MAVLRAAPMTGFFGRHVHGNLQNAVGGAIRREIDKVLVSFNHDRANALNVADNDQELEKLSGACVRML